MPKYDWEIEEEILTAVIKIQRTFRASRVRKLWNLFRTVRIREMVLKPDSINRMSYGFISSAQYVHDKHRTNLVEVLFNYRHGSVIAMDTRGVSSWKSQTQTCQRLFDFPKYYSNYLLQIFYSKRYNVYYTLGKGFCIKTFNHLFNEIDEVPITQCQTSLLLFSELTDEVIAVGPSGTYVFILQKRDSNVWGSIKPMANYELKVSKSFSGAGGSWAKNGFVSTNGKFFFLCSECNMGGYSLSTGEKFFWIYGAHNDSITGVDVYSANNIISIASDCCLKVWKVLNSSSNSVGHIGTWTYVHALTWLQRHPTLSNSYLVATSEGAVLLFSLDIMNVIYTCQVSSEHPIKHLRLISKNSLLVSTIRGINVFHLNQFVFPWSEPVSTQILQLREFSEPFKAIVVLGRDNSSRLIMCESGQCLTVLMPPPSGHSSSHPIAGIAVCPNFLTAHVLINSMTMWIYSMKTCPASLVDVIDLSDLQLNAIQLAAEVAGDDMSSRFPTDEDLLHHAVNHGFAVLEPSDINCIASLHFDRIQYWTKKFGTQACTQSDFVLLGLQDGRVLFMDPLKSDKKHVDLRASKYPILRLKYYKHYPGLAVLSGRIHEILFITIWSLPELAVLAFLQVQPFLRDFDIAANSLLAGHANGSVNLHILTKNYSSHSELNTALGQNPSSLHTFKESINESCDILFQEYATLSSQSVQDGIGHSLSVICVNASPLLHVFLTTGEDGFLKVWSKCRRLLKSIYLGESLSTAVFISDYGDIVAGFQSNLFLIKRHFTFPELRDIRYESYSLNMPFIFEDPELRMKISSKRKPSLLNFENYIVPFDLKDTFYRSTVKKISKVEFNSADQIARVASPESSNYSLSSDSDIFEVNPSVYSSLEDISRPMYDYNVPSKDYPYFNYSVPLMIASPTTQIGADSSDSSLQVEEVEACAETTGTNDFVDIETVVDKEERISETGEVPQSETKVNNNLKDETNTDFTTKFKNAYSMKFRPKSKKSIDTNNKSPIKVASSANFSEIERQDIESSPNIIKRKKSAKSRVNLHKTLNPIKEKPIELPENKDVNPDSSKRKPRMRKIQRRKKADVTECNIIYDSTNKEVDIVPEFTNSTSKNMESSVVVVKELPFTQKIIVDGNATSINFEDISLKEKTIRNSNTTNEKPKAISFENRDYSLTSNDKAIPSYARNRDVEEETFTIYASINNHNDDLRKNLTNLERSSLSMKLKSDSIPKMRSQQQYMHYLKMRAIKEERFNAVARQKFQDIINLSFKRQQFNRPKTASKDIYSAHYILSKERSEFKQNYSQSGSKSVFKDDAHKIQYRISTSARNTNSIACVLSPERPHSAASIPSKSRGYVLLKSKNVKEIIPTKPELKLLKERMPVQYDRVISSYIESPF